MAAFVIRRLVAFVPMLLLLSFITFVLSYYGPGDPIQLIMGDDWTSEEVRQNLRHQYGLDRPILVQFGDYLVGAVQGDFGRSYIQRVSVGELLAKALPVSAQLAIASTLLIAFFGIGFGIIAALWHHRWPDISLGIFAVFLHSVPSFVFAPVILVVLVVQLDLISTPTGWHGFFSVPTLIAAAIIGAGPLLAIMRQTRTGVVDTLTQDFVRTARAKGVSERRVIIVHVLSNALAPVTTSLGLIFGALLGSSIFVESAFAIPGLGQLYYTAIRTSDYPLLMGATIVSAFWIMLMNLVVDVLYTVLDPRVRLGGD